MFVDVEVVIVNDVGANRGTVDFLLHSLPVLPVLLLLPLLLIVFIISLAETNASSRTLTKKAAHNSSPQLER